jgi:hypothetical protein
MRDGVGALTPGRWARGVNWTGWCSALTEALPALSGPFGPGAAQLWRAGGRVVSVVGTSRNLSEADQSYQASRSGELRTLEARNGVDTDDECSACC